MCLIVRRTCGRVAYYWPETGGWLFRPAPSCFYGSAYVAACVACVLGAVVLTTPNEALT